LKVPEGANPSAKEAIKAGINTHQRRERLRCDAKNKDTSMPRPRPVWHIAASIVKGMDHASPMGFIEKLRSTMPLTIRTRQVPPLAEAVAIDDLV